MQKNKIYQQYRVLGCIKYLLINKGYGAMRNLLKDIS